MSAGSPRAGAAVAMSPRTLRLLFVVGSLALYGGVVLYLGGLSFEPVKDEEQFWEQVQSFAQDWPPGLEQLRSYDQPMTPLAFLLWAGLEAWHGGGIAAARLATLVCSLFVLAMIALQLPSPGTRPETSLLAALGLLLYPYWLPMGLLVYTDVPATAFVVCGMFFYVRDHHLASASFFAAAIATRQYSITFPAAILAYEGLVALRSGTPAFSRWLPYLVALGTLFGWFHFFGALGPKPGLEEWPRHTSAFQAIKPAFALYALVALGAYFVAFEFVVERRWRGFELRVDRRTAAALAGAVLLFAIFPPYYPERVGFLNRGLIYLLGDGAVARVVQIAVLLAFLCATVARFAHGGLGAWVVAANVAVMPFVWSPWEKYYMPTLAVLWFLKAAGALDGPPPRIRDPRAEDDAELRPALDVRAPSRAG